MEEFEGLINLGRKATKTSTGSKRGLLIQLEGRRAVLTNTKRSCILVLTFEKDIGTGTFYANEAPTMAEKVTRRDDKVLIEWTEDQKERRIYIPNQNSIIEEADEAFQKMFQEPTIRVPLETYEVIESDLLITELSVEGNNIHISQERSDGTVKFESLLQIGKGFVEEDYPATGEVSIFTNDIMAIKDFVKSLNISIVPQKPLSLRGEMNFGATFVGLISDLMYE